MSEGRGGEGRIKDEPVDVMRYNYEVFDRGGSGSRPGSGSGG